MALKRVSIVFLAVVTLVVALSGLTVRHSVASTTTNARNQIAPIDPTCTSSSPCIEYQNKGTGPGLEGTSTGGNGSVGLTFLKSTSASNGHAGLFGGDYSASGAFNSGVKGVSTNGTGVEGNSANGTGVVGETTFTSATATVGQAGVTGMDLGNTNSVNAGVLGTSTNGNAGVQGNGISAYGLLGSTQFPSTTILPYIGGEGGVIGFDMSTDGGNGDFGVAGASNNGVGAYGASNVVGVYGKPYTPMQRVYIPNPSGGFIQTGVIGLGHYGIAALGFDTAASNNPALYVQDMNGGVLIRAGGPSSDVLSLDAGGNLILAGNLTVDGSITQGGASVTTCSPCPHPLTVHRTANGTRVATFTTQQSMPSVEDFGQGQLTGGQAYVHIDSAFASVMDSRSPYLVFITPEGDNRGLYITQKSSYGFFVRESQGGHSTLIFDYRIVAKPLDAQLERLPHVNLARLGSGVHTRAFAAVVRRVNFKKKGPLF